MNKMCLKVLPLEIEKLVLSYLNYYELRAIHLGGSCVRWSATEFLWSCSKNHHWIATKNTILPNRWCPICC